MAKLKIRVVLSDYALGGPAQQMLDRLLLGWTADGRVMSAPDWTIEVGLVGDEIPAVLQERQRQFGAMTVVKLATATAGVQGLIIATNQIPAGDWQRLLASCEDRGVVVFLGPWGVASDVAGAVMDKIQQKQLRIWTTHPDEFLIPLPATEVFASADACSEGLIVAPRLPVRAMEAVLGAWLPRIGRRTKADLNVRRLRKWVGTGVWKAQNEWPQDLFRVAIARSDNPLGDGERESRVQDMIGLGLVPGLTQQIEVLQLDHADGFRSTLVLPSGVINDTCLAARTRSGRVVSGQLFRPGAPQFAQYDRLVDCLVRFVDHPQPADGHDIGLVWTQLMRVLESPRVRSGIWLEC